MNIKNKTGELLSWHQSFSNNISGWSSDNPVYRLNNEENCLKINYTRTGSLSEAWSTFVYSYPAGFDFSPHPFIALKIKSSADTNLSLKPYNAGSNLPPVSHFLKSSPEWQIIKFEIHPGSINPAGRIYFYLDADTTIKNEGVVCVSKIFLGEAADNLVVKDELVKAISHAEARLSHNENIPGAGTKALSRAIDNAGNILNDNNADQKKTDETIWRLYDECVNYETADNEILNGMADPHATGETRKLYGLLKNIQGKKLLLGMQNATGTGYGWSGDDNRSDIKQVCGDYPAISGEEFNKADLNSGKHRLIYRLTKTYNAGSIITLCWHQYDPQFRGYKKADAEGENVVREMLPGGRYHEAYKTRLKNAALFFKSLRDKNGRSIPVIFRPFHEHTNSYFWWGISSCTPGEYIKLWQFTVTFLRDELNVHNLLYAFSPILQESDSGENYLNRYPGDEFVDILGADFYFKGYYPPLFGYYKLKKGLRILTFWSKQKNKPAALTEIGERNLPAKNWFTKILHIIKIYPVAYMLLWHNDSKDRFYAPYPGHKSAEDFIKFYNDDFVVFQKDMGELTK